METVHNLSPLFPGGKRKALTFSYDDGVEEDIRLIDLFRKNGLKGTFNLNSGLFAPNGEPAGTLGGVPYGRRLTAEEAKEVYNQPGIEVATHGWTHPNLKNLPAPQIAYEALKDRELLEKLFGRVIRGMAYPFGQTSDEVVRVLKDCGIVYSRTVHSTEKFTLPTEFLTWDPTCHHTKPCLFELADKFFDQPAPAGTPWLFYVWGHAYEFASDNNWDLIERFCARAAGHDDVWYATNMEIRRCISAFRSLVFSADATRVFNPTCETVWFEFAGNVFSVAPGEEISLI